MKVKYVPIKMVVPYHLNPRRIPKEATEKVAHSIKTFGWRQPISVEPKNEAGKYVILAGHTRHSAAQLLGQKKVPVNVVVGLSEDKMRAWRVADNRVAEQSSWDIKKLREEVAGIPSEFLAGAWSEDELTAILFDVEEEARDGVKKSRKKHASDGLATIEFVVPRTFAKSLIMRIQKLIEEVVAGGAEEEPPKPKRVMIKKRKFTHA